MIHAVAKTLVTVNPHSLSEHLRLGSITPLLALCRCNKLYLYTMQYFVTSVYSVIPYYFHQIPALCFFVLSLFNSLCLSLSLCLSVSLSLSLSLFITHTISLSLFLSLFFSFFTLPICSGLLFFDLEMLTLRICSSSNPVWRLLI